MLVLDAPTVVMISVLANQVIITPNAKNVVIVILLIPTEQHGIVSTIQFKMRK